MNNSELTTNVKVRGAEEAARKIQSVRDKINEAGGSAAGSASGFNLGSTAAGGLQRALSSVGSAVVSFSQKIVGIAWGAFKTGIAAAAAAVVGLGAKGLNSASQLQSLQISMNGLTGSMEAGSKAMATAYQYAQKAPFQLPEVAQTTKSLIAMGVQVDQTGAMLETIGGIAITSGAQITDIGRIYGQVFATGKLQLEDMNQLTDNGVGIQKALEKQFGVTSETVRQMATDGKISFEDFNKAMSGMVDPAILEQLNNTLPRQIDRLKGSVRQLSNAFVGFGVDATNGAQMASNGLAQAATNITKALADALRTDELKAKLADIGNGLVPAVQQIQAQIPNILGIITGLAAPIASAFSGIVGGITSLISGAAPGLNTFFSGLNVAVQSLAPVLSEVGSILGTALTTALTALTPALQPLAQTIAVLAPPLAKIIGFAAQFAATLISSLAPILPPIAQALAQIAEGIMPMLSAMLAALQPYWQALATAFQQIIQALMPLIPPLLQLAMVILQQMLLPMMPIIIQLIQIFSSVITMLLNALMPILPPIIQLASTLITALAPILPTIANLFLQLITALMPILPPILQLISILLPPLIQLLSFIIGVVAQVAGVLAGVLVAAISTAISWIGNIINWVVNAINWFGNLAGRIGGAMASFVGAISGGISSAISWFAGLPGRILQGLGNLGSLLLGAGKNLIDGLVNGITNAKDAVINKVKDIAKGALDAIKNFFGIKSPSRVMANMGSYMMQGMRNGLESMRSAVVSTAESISGDIQDGISTDANVTYSTPGSLQAAVSNAATDANTGYANSQSAAAVANSQQAPAGGNIVINFHGPVNMRNEEEVEDVGAQLARQLQAARAGAY